MSVGQERAGAQTMRAAFFNEPGPAEVIHVEQLPVPVPGPTDALVAVEVAVVDPVDTLIRSGRWSTLTPLPFVTGRDLVGTVAAAGPGSGFSPGERVWSNSLGHAGRQGACADYAVVPGDRLYRLPEGVPAAQTAAVFRLRRNCVHRPAPPSPRPNRADDPGWRRGRRHRDGLDPVRGRGRAACTCHRPSRRPCPLPRTGRQRSLRLRRPRPR